MAVGTLTKLGGNLESPRNSSPSDYSAVGPSGAAGMQSGAGQLVKLTQDQEGPRHTEDSGDNTPSVWGVKGFNVGKSKGEGEGGSSMAIKCSVDLSTGQTVPNAEDMTY